MERRIKNTANKLIDLTGQKFGKLTVIGRSEDKVLPSGRKVVNWKCICDCQSGQESPKYTFKTWDSLKRNPSPSCGCDTNEKHRKSRIKNLKGMKFGKLTVLEQAEDQINENGRHYIIWKCICDCQLNNETPQYTYVRGTHLTSGDVKSCGCLAKELSSKRECIDIIGNKYGMLTVVSRGENTKTGQTQWWCQCDCGSDLKLITKSNLISGNTFSCGCYNQRKRKDKNNTYDLSGEYGIGYTSKGEEFYFDLEDYDKIKERYWFKTNNGYFATKSYGIPIMLHRFILNLPSFQYDNPVDHINHNTFDNRKVNLRITNNSQNNMNKGLASNNTSGVKGVNFDKNKNLWIARISAYKVRYHLGGFVNKQDAIRARKEAEEILHGEYSYDNSIKKGELNG